MGQALYRKYRPKNLEDIIGQEHITTTLKNSIDNGSLSHAYLLTGPRGVGKTSIARILAHEINKLEYNEASNHLDIIEIDAASNRRIDEIRELRDKVNILPSVVEYKIYIIDEVHMLTREAFNALLKTLEEPPKHAIFILATTEAHKLPETIISRTQHFSFKPIDEDSLFKHLKNIAKQEGIKIDDEALQLISVHGDGSFRDSISLLDQTAASKNQIDVETVQTMLGLAPKQTIVQIVDSLETTSPKELIDITSQMRDRGVQTSVLSKQLAELIRSKIISDPNYQQDKYLKLLEAIINVTSSVNPNKQLEIELLSFVISNNPKSTTQTVEVEATPTPVALAQETKPAPTVRAEKPKPAEPKPTKEEVKKVDKPETESTHTKPKDNPAPKTTTDPTIQELNDGTWPQVLNEIKKKYNTLYGVLRMAEVSVQDNIITLSFKFPFHKKKIDDQKNKVIVSDMIKTLTGKDFQIVSAVIVPREPTKSKTDKKTNAVSSVSDIFGGGELLES